MEDGTSRNSVETWERARPAGIVWCTHVSTRWVCGEGVRGVRGRGGLPHLQIERKALVSKLPL
eukprot:7386282-Prymnesium_polylepis.2